MSEPDDNDTVVEVFYHKTHVDQTDPSGRFERYSQCLGKGAYKEVYKAFDQEEGVEVAWNQLRLSHKDALRIQSEIEILQSLRNDNIINFFHSWVDNDRVCFISELMTSGTLKSYIRRSKGPVKLKILKNWCKQILSGLSYLHSRDPPIIHRDLKCENIFINGNNGQAKIGDLGLATFKRTQYVSSVLGTPEFMAPELYDERYDEKVDIYSFGMVVLEIVTKEYPYNECTNQAQIYKKVTSGIKPQALTRILDPEIQKFINQCIEFDPAKRPSADELLKHPFVTLSTNLSFNSETDSAELVAARDQISDTSRSASPASITEKRPSVSPSGLNMTSDSTKPSQDSVEFRTVHNFEVSKVTHVPGQEYTPLFISVEKMDKNSIHLRLTYKSNAQSRHQDIRFPFNFRDDTAAAVVNEMVHEKLVEAKDETLVVQKLEELLVMIKKTSDPRLIVVGHERQEIRPNSPTMSDGGLEFEVKSRSSLSTSEGIMKRTMSVPSNNLQQSLSGLNLVGVPKRANTVASPAVLQNDIEKLVASPSLTATASKPTSLEYPKSSPAVGPLIPFSVPNADSSSGVEELIGNTKPPPKKMDAAVEQRLQELEEFNLRALNLSSSNLSGAFAAAKGPTSSLQGTQVSSTKNPGSKSNPTSSVASKPFSELERSSSIKSNTSEGSLKSVVSPALPSKSVLGNTKNLMDDVDQPAVFHDAGVQVPTPQVHRVESIQPIRPNPPNLTSSSSIPSSQQPQDLL